MVIQSYKAILEHFIELQRSNAEQYSLLFNYLLPEYERSCLTVFLNQNSDGKVIFIDETDDKLAQLINRMVSLLLCRNKLYSGRILRDFMRFWTYKKDK